MTCALLRARTAWASVPNHTRYLQRPSTQRFSAAMAQALPDHFVLKDKTIVVTGASRGIGLEFVKQLLEKGNTVIAAVRNPEAVHLQELKAANPKCIALAVDVADLTSIQDWASKVAEVSPTVDVVINNAGLLYRNSVRTVTPEEMMESYKVNTMGPLFIVQALLQRELLPSGSLIATLTSLVGSITENGSGGNYAYRCSKIAANMVVKSMSIDLAPQGITSTILHPGYVRTDMTGGEGLIEVSESVKGMLEVLESKDKPLNGQWYHTSGRHLPW